MQELLSNLVFILERFTWASFLDIVLVTIVFAFILYLLRDTEAQTLLRGIFLIVILVTLLISLLDLPGFTWLVDTISPALIFAIPVVLAPEIRRGLERMGNVSSLSLFKRRSEKASENLELTLQAVTAAVLQLSQRRHGALIILRRKQFLDSYYKNGVLLDSIVTPQILMQIFYPNTPLHDGAVIIDENRIKAAACVMPLSSSGVLNATVDNSLGLRHRAALGISEVSDAIAVPVVVGLLRPAILLPAQAEVWSEERRRIVDFLFGVIHAVDGDVCRVDDTVFIFTPNRISIDAPDAEVARRAMGSTIPLRSHPLRQQAM